MFHKSILKITSLLLIIGLNYSGLFAVGETVASFNDMETSEDNFYTAGTLDFSLRFERDNFESVILAQNMKPEDVVSRDIYVKKEGNLTLRYKALSEFIPGNCDEDLYNALKLKILYKYFAEEDGKTILKEVLRYDDLLRDFDDFGTNPKDPDLWIPNDHEYVENEFYSEDEHWLSFLINLSEDIPEETLEDLWNRSCEFKFVFDGWQKDPNCEKSNGFIDEEEIYNGLASSGLRINEVYYHSIKSDGEWIEIYNQTNASIDIEEWVIEDDKGEQKRTIIENSFCDPSCAIPAQGYAVIAGKDKIWDHWPIPSATVKITLDKKIGNELGKKGDRVILKRQDGTEIDAMSYGDDDTVFELDSVEKGQSLGRGPDGYDTNEASDWLDQGKYGPSPGWSNLIVEDIGGENVEILDIDEVSEEANGIDMDEGEDIEIPMLDIEDEGGDDSVTDDGDGTKDSTQENGANEENDDMKNEEVENKENENDENDSGKDVNSDDANGSTARSLSRTEIREDNGASDEDGDDYIKNKEVDTNTGSVDDIEDGDGDNTKDSTQENGANDGNNGDDDTDIKNEEYVLNPKEEEDSTEENKEINSDDTNGSTRENGANSGLNENSVDCVQAIK
ncbi:lamin tail domain-containing protein [Candidatus Parcubacteria bacterium]|nr:lamin tail domain-containing protein [Candidatus Parcubacteria bacterium]